MTQTEGGSRSKERRRTNLSFAQCSLRLCQRLREKPAIVSVHRTSCDDIRSPAHHAYFAEQLSLLRCAVRYKRVRTKIENCKASARSIGARPVSVARMVKVHAVAGDAEETIFHLFRQRRSNLTTIAFAYATASALLTKCNSFPMPRFCQTCGRKYRTPCGGRSAKRGLLNNSQ